MSSFLLAVQFLTLIPLKIKDAGEKKIAKAAAYFPLVGLLIGLVLLGINYIISILNFPSFTSNVILVVALIALTGGMHLDGLSDTADAFLSNKPKDEMLAIMRDPHIGVMGVLSVISVILLKIGLLAALQAPLKITALLLMCLLSRWSVVAAIFLFPYARREGKAKIFMQGRTPGIFVLALISVLVFSFAIWQIKGLIALLIIAGFVYLFGRFASRKIGGITGDTLGATIELTEVITLLIVCITRGVIYG
ncbi:MAG: adenosylcobinamide-GDP ribazoletransferase [Candidatus Omnitrophica bacterium]|nr:adenosylcobinamide-GDP ribazoletransferase [Candidatus Omnitrophota bacterium]